MGYVILTSTDDRDMVKQVNEKLADGWRLHGSLKTVGALTYTGYGSQPYTEVRFYQAMIRE